MLKNFEDFLNENELNEKAIPVDFSKMEWMTVGKQYTEDMPRIHKLINSMEWKPITPKLSLGYAQGSAIKSFIKEFKVPKASMYALPSGTFSTSSDKQASYSILGVQGSYKNGTYRFYFVDTGSELVPIGALNILPGKQDIIDELGEKPSAEAIMNKYGVDDAVATIIAQDIEINPPKN